MEAGTQAQVTRVDEAALLCHEGTSAQQTLLCHEGISAQHSATQRTLWRDDVIYIIVLVVAIRLGAPLLS